MSLTRHARLLLGWLIASAVVLAGGIAPAAAMAANALGLANAGGAAYRYDPPAALPSAVALPPYVSTTPTSRLSLTTAGGEANPSASRGYTSTSSPTVVAAEETAGAADALAGEGETVYRVHGGESGLWGHSWTPTDPRTLENPRDALGLPNVNSGENLTIGRVKDWTGVVGRRALPLDGTNGGAPEYLFPDPEGQIQHVSTQSLNPPF